MQTMTLNSKTVFSPAPYQPRHTFDLVGRLHELKMVTAAWIGLTRIGPQTCDQIDPCSNACWELVKPAFAWTDGSCVTYQNWDLTFPSCEPDTASEPAVRVTGAPGVVPGTWLDAPYESFNAVAFICEQ